MKNLYYLILIVVFIQLIFAIDSSSDSSGGISIDTSLSGGSNSGGNSNGNSGSDSTLIGEDGSTTITCPPCTCNDSNDVENNTDIKFKYTCGSNTCNSKEEVCQSVYGVNDGCIPRDKLEVIVETKVINSWSQNNNKDNYTQFDATIKNNANRDIKQIYIYLDPESFKLRDNQSLWNMIPAPSKDNHIILPLYQQTINSNQSFTFGFIIESPVNNSLNLTINQIIFA